MKKLRKVTSILKDNSGESIVEVLVAFTVLSIMLLIFAEGLQMATRNSVNADKSRDGADAAMATVQSRIAAGEPLGVEGQEIELSNSGDEVTGIVPYTYTVDGYTYVIYQADP